MVKRILIGEGVVAGNVHFAGSPVSLAVFTDSSQSLGLTKGLLLTTGNVFFVNGPNDANDQSWLNGFPGDKDLEKLTTGITFDAAVLEFDFITASENLVFNFVFASEEYPEYVDSKYNDVFAFIIDGPGIQSKNLALLPGTQTPIAINNVNHKRNSQYYRNNHYRNIVDKHIWDVRSRKFIRNPDYRKRERRSPYHTQYDGFTTVLQAACPVTPNEVYHIKIAIADVSDGILDSGVLLEAESFSSYGKMTVPIDSFYFGIDEEWLAQLPPDQTDIHTDEKSNAVDTLQNEKFYVYFAFDSCGLDAGNEQALKGFGEKLVDSPHNYKAFIKGHTDSKGSDQYNLELSACRTETVKELLIGLGIPEKKLAGRFFGERRPADTNDTERGRANNRRVEVEIIYEPVEKVWKKQ